MKHALNSDIQPYVDTNGFPCCWEECPSQDGGRCTQASHEAAESTSPGTYCIPAIESLVTITRWEDSAGNTLTFRNDPEGLSTGQWPRRRDA